MREPRAFVRCALLGIALPLLLSGDAAHAQIVNVQPLMSPGGEDGLSGQLKGTVDWRTGNVDLFLGAASLLLRYQDGPYRLISSSKAELGIKNGADFVETAFSHLRGQLDISALVTAEIFGQVASNRFARLSLRGLVGGGPRLNLLRGEITRLAWGIAYMFEHERLTGGASAGDSGATDNRHRLSTYLTGSTALNELLSLVGTVYFQPRLDAFSDDFRLLVETQLVVKLVERVALSTAMTIRYDADPPVEVDGLDTALTVSLVLGF